MRTIITINRPDNAATSLIVEDIHVTLSKLQIYELKQRRRQATVIRNPRDNVYNHRGLSTLTSTSKST